MLREHMTTFEPRKVDRNPIRRWLIQSLKLYFRSPLIMGTATGLALGFNFALSRLGELVDSDVGMWILITLLTPVALGIGCLFARRADVGAHHRNDTTLRTTLRGLAQYVFSTAAFESIIWTLIMGPMLFRIGRYHHLDVACNLSFMFQFALFDFCLYSSIFSAPLLSFWSLDPHHAHSLSEEAIAVNDGLRLKLGGFALAAAFITSIPALKVVGAVIVVLQIVMIYVAYRDIFEGRAENESPVKDAAAVVCDA
jgi:hypothetical protein